jgi:hypothetical protein
MGPDLVELELQRCHDGKVLTSTAQSPEQLGFRLRRRRGQVPLHGHELDGDEVVDGMSELPRQPPGATTEDRPGDADR